MINKLLFSALFFPAVATAQIPGRKIETPVQIGVYTVAPGDTLHLGRGSMPNGRFAHIEEPRNPLMGIPQSHFRSQYAGTFLLVKHAKRQKSPQTGEKILLIINPSGGINCTVDLLPAIETGEVTGINSLRVGRKAVPAFSVADELLKLKQLLDSGTITESEYREQKKKLLQ